MILIHHFHLSLRWESQVSEALNENIATMQTNAYDEINAIDRNIMLIDNTHKALSILSDKAIKKARRRSMGRRKVS